MPFFIFLFGKTLKNLLLKQRNVSVSVCELLFVAINQQKQKKNPEGKSIIRSITKQYADCSRIHALTHTHTQANTQQQNRC